MDRPDCLEDIFALVSSICSTFPDGSKAFWKIVEHQDLDEDGMPLELVLRLAPSRFLERLDLIHADSDSFLFVYLSFLASLALADGTWRRSYQRSINNQFFSLRQYHDKSPF
jgi:hypothetical protein